MAASENINLHKEKFNLWLTENNKSNSAILTKEVYGQLVDYLKAEKNGDVKSFP